MTTAQLLITVAIAALCTIALRTLPFVLFPGGRKVPSFVTWLGTQLPRAVMAMLLVYCLKDLDFTGMPYGLPALLGVVATVLLHLWQKKMILSIAGGTAVYMLLIRLMGA